MRGGRMREATGQSRGAFPVRGANAAAAVGCVLVWLVVIAYGLLLLKAWRDPAGQKSCSTQLQAGAMALRMYAEDHDLRLPPAGRWMTDIGRYLPRRYLGSGIEPECPSAPAGRGPGLAFNSRLSSAEVLSDVVMEGRVAMLYDSSLPGRNAADAAASMPYPGRHHGLNNVVSADCTVRTVRARRGAGP